jgi:putative ATPase
MLEAGEDPKFICRRMLILASEDIGLADSNALNVAVSASRVLDYVGLPEARLALAHAAIYLACAPKSNSVIKAIDAAISDVREADIGRVPRHLRDGSYKGAKELGHGKG